MRRFNSIGFCVILLAFYMSAALGSWVLWEQNFPWPVRIIAAGVVSAYLVLYIVLIILVIVAVTRAILAWPEWPFRIYRANDQAGINRYLYRQIDSGGRVAIWTRDMCWADTEKMTELLRRKAQRGQLIICLPQEIPQSDELKQIGAEVFAYGASPAADYRFIIVNYGRAGSRVAVVRFGAKFHWIQEYAAGDQHPAFYMAQDLVRMVRERPDADL